MITLKEIAKPNPKVDNYDTTIYEFYENNTLIGRATYSPKIWKTKLSIEIWYNNDSKFYKIWNSNWQSVNKSNLSKSNALKVFIESTTLIFS